MSKIKSHIPLFAGLLAFVLILFSARAAIADLWGAWQTEEYSHGILIPFVALWLAWCRLARKRPALRPSWQGIGWLAFAGVLQSIAQLSGFQMAAQYGLIAAFTGLSLCFFGAAATRRIAPALIYLIFAVPLPHLIQAELSQRLQLWSSSLGVAPLDLAGIPVFQQGNIIDLGGFQLQVVEACSGLRYLFPLMSFGYLMALLIKDKWWKRIVLVLSTIPLAIGLNALRIAFIGVTVDLWGDKMARGFLHDFEGWSVFLICIVILMLEAWILLRVGARGRFRYDYFAIPNGKLFTGNIALEKPGIAALLIALLYAVLFGSGVIDRRDEIIPAHPSLTSFPLELGDWYGQPDQLDADVLQGLHLSDYWLADYEKPDGGTVNLYIAYYASQRTGSEAHSPSNCIPGGGWQIDTSRTEKVRLPNGTTIKLTRLLIRRGDQAQLVYYWFDERGRDITETTVAKWYLLRDSILMHRTDGALIRLTTPVGGGENEDEASGRLNNFLALAWPKITTFIPGPAAK